MNKKIKKVYSGYLLPFLVLLPLIWIVSCSGSPGKERNKYTGVNPPDPAAVSERFIKMVIPGENSEYKLKDQIKVSIESVSRNQTPDSVRVIFDGQLVSLIKSEPWECAVPSTLTLTAGRKPVKAVAYTKGKIQTITRFVIIYSDVIPKKDSYKIVHTYPHDPDAFTQGLFYNDGLFYEGTGQEAGSSLREVLPETGKVVRQHNLETSLFGEGITLFKDRIYQVTWRNKVGFVYDKTTFKTINKIYYQTEGWGLTTINDRVAMSDGTNIIYFFEPEMFNLVSRIEVYDNEKKVDQLNELEYIKGEIWANIWQSDLIARIDPETGKVNSYIDLASVYPESERIKANADVLNGIAYDAVNNRIFVTGKRWPKLYEISITE
jgi:glutamine cyclotransferase